MANSFTPGLQTTMALNGTALIESGSQTSAAIPNSGRAVIRLGFPTITSTTVTFLVQAYPLSGAVAEAAFRSLVDKDGNAVSYTIGSDKIVTIPELSGCAAFKLVMGSAEASDRTIEVTSRGDNPVVSPTEIDVNIEGSTTVTANLGTPVTSTTATETGVAANAGSVTVLAANALRKGALITNSPGSADLYLRFSATAASIASGGYSVVLTAGQTYEMGANVYSGQINGIWSSAVGFANVTEF